MGYDIHAVVEYEKYDTYSSLTHGELNIPRDYRLFTVLALGEGGIKDDLPYPPRGLPSDLSYEARDIFFTGAEEVRRFVAELGGGSEGFRPEEYAEEFGEWTRKEYAESGLLPVPEWHTPGWVNLNELKEVLTYGKLTAEKLSPEFRAILAAMQELAEARGGEKVRLVFCFDGIG
jgi:hypothetical protein